MCLIASSKQVLAPAETKPQALKECEKYHPRTKKFINFQGVERPMGLMEKEEEKELLNYWFSFWKNTFICWNIGDIYTPEGQAQFRVNVKLWGSLLTSFSLFLIFESSFYFSAPQIATAAVVGYYISVFVFGIGHMSLHARMLDYHWKASRTAFYVFAYMHHRVHGSSDTFTNQLLIMTLPTARPGGLPKFEYFKYLSLGYLCWALTHTRLLLGWFLLSYVMEAACHHAAHGQTRSLPLLVRVIVECVFSPLGLIPSKEHHHQHHDITQETRFSNFTDLSAPIADIVLNKIWDLAYFRYFKQGQLHDKGFSLTRSWIVSAIYLVVVFGAWLASKSVGLDATYLCLWIAMVVNAIDPFRIYVYCIRIKNCVAPSRNC